MNNNLKRVLMVFLCAFLFSTLCACNFDESRNNFSGGQLLDEERLSEIKNSILSEESNVEETEKDLQTQNNEDFEDNTKSTTSDEIEATEKEENTNGEKEESSSESVEQASGESISDIGSEEITEFVSEEQIVYWTESGKVWHLSSDCHHLKNSENILSGTVEEALAEKKTKLCSSCEK